MDIKVHGKSDEKIVSDCQSIDIMAEDGRVLYSLYLTDAGALGVNTDGMVVNHKGIMLDSRIKILPGSAGSIRVEREPYKK